VVIAIAANQKVVTAIPLNSIVQGVAYAINIFATRGGAIASANIYRRHRNILIICTRMAIAYQNGLHSVVVLPDAKNSTSQYVPLVDGKALIKIRHDDKIVFAY
jgi:hypothetical protein